jgi:uncharacterized protein YeaO (DUF488 family)
MPVTTKSIYEPAAPEDGVRVLTTNYWPRGVSRERAGIYKRVLAPSRPLLRSFLDGQVAWPEYASMYLEEMSAEDPAREIGALVELAMTDTVTIMCVCKDDSECHRRLLRDLISQRLEATG